MADIEIPVLVVDGPAITFQHEAEGGFNADR
jgi:hypothetical protein